MGSCRNVRKCAASWLTACCAVIIAVASGGSAAAQVATSDLVVKRSRHTGLATFVTVQNRGKTKVSAKIRSAAAPSAILRSVGPMFGITDPARQMVRAEQRIGGLGNVHTVYTQVHDGVEVFTGLLKVHQDAAGGLVAVNGDFYVIDAKLNTSPDLSAAEAEAAAVALVENAAPTLKESRLVVVDPSWYGDPPSGQHLAYYLILADPSVAMRDAFLIDAHTGELIDRWSLIHSLKNRKIYNAFQSGNIPGTLVRAEGNGRAFNPEVDHAYDYFGDVYDYFQRAFGRDSLDDNGLPLVATVNSQALNGGCPNAAWIGGIQQVLFCTGLTTDDIAGHELMHGITEFSANLVYQNQSGQMNESFSDIFGELVDLFNGDAAWVGPPGGTPWPKDSDYLDNGLDFPNSTRAGCTTTNGNPRWLIGEDWSLIRDMWSPTCKGQPDRALSALQTCGGANGDDNGGVHGGSGIPNHAFAIMTDGKFFNGYNVTGIGPIKAGAVWYRALTVYLTPGSDFLDLYNALNQAAADLIGTVPNDPRTGGPSDSVFSASDAAEVDKALLAVEMNADGVCGATVAILDPTTPPLCAPRNIIYRADFESGAPGWTSAITAGTPATPYDWVRTGSLPLGRPGAAFFCDDPNIGDCSPTGDESAVHSLYSPVISIPPGTTDLKLSFTHYVATEPGWDGGNLKIKTNGLWQFVPAVAFTHNPYNDALQTQGQGNTNPLEVKPAYTGAGGGWGTSLVDLGPMVAGAQSMQFRFDFGKDGCTGLDGWYIDDFEIYECSNCPNGFIEWITPADGVIDARQPRDPATGTPQGIDLIEANGPSDADTACWSLCVTANDATPNRVVNATETAPGTYLIQLERPITAGAISEITYTSTAGTTDTAMFTSLPADSDGDLTASASDVAAMVDCCLTNACAPLGDEYECDIDRSRTVTSEDLLRLIDLLNGAGQGAKAWNMESPRDDGRCNATAITP